MMKFSLLCSGSKGNSFLLEDDGTKVLIDCGSTKKYLLHALHENLVDVEQLDALILTHDHSDHVSQIKTFKDIDIYSPIEIDDIETFSVHPLKKFAINNLIFTPIALSHDAPHTTGYIIEDGIEKLVYVTDTGYVNQRYISLMKGADYIVLESNHDVDMLMHTSRPRFLKQRIYSDEGHLNNEDCAQVLDEIVDENTKMILLAHISQEANTREKALEVSRERLKRHVGKLHKDCILCAAGQFEMIQKGENNEEVYPGSVSCAIGLEHLSNRQDQ